MRGTHAVRVTALVAVCALVPVLATSSSASTTEATDYVVVFKQGNGLPANADVAVVRAGGEVVSRLPQAGALAARSADPSFEAALEADPAVLDVSRNIEVQMVPDLAELALGSDEPGPAEPTGPDPQPMPDTRGNQQWDKMRMNATLSGSYAVQRGRRDVRVAVIDTGADVLPRAHPDIAPNLDTALSRSFVGATGGVQGDPNPASWDDKHGHGSWCLSAVGAPINGAGTSGVAPNVTLVALKVLNDAGSGTFLDVAEAIVYAGIHRFDVASMSIGGYINHTEYNALYVLLQRAIQFARSNGVLPVAALANNNFDLSDGAFMRDFLEVPGEMPGVVGVSSTGYYDQKSYFSNYGVGKADVSAPGGDRIYQVSPPPYRGGGRTLGAWARENTGGVPPPLLEEECDPAPPQPGCSSYAWVQGTSMATPNAAGVAALIVSQYGDFTPDGSKKAHMAPTEVESILQITANNRPCPEPRTVEYSAGPTSQPPTAECQGDAGYNGFYGKGIVDALEAVTAFSKQPRG